MNGVTISMEKYCEGWLLFCLSVCVYTRGVTVIRDWLLADQIIHCSRKNSFEEVLVM